MNYDDDLELVCDRCDVKISETERAYTYKLEIICEECEDNRKETKWNLILQ